MELDEQRSRIRNGLIRNGVYRLNAPRSEVVKSVFDANSNSPSLHEKEVKVKFNDELGEDVGGLRRELVNLFWNEFKQTMDGSMEKVPQVFPNNLSEYYSLGRFLFHAYVMTGFFPICLSKVCATALVCGKEFVTDSELVSSFYEFIDPFEANALRQCMRNEDERLLQEVIIPLFSRFCVFSIPSPNILPQMVLDAARYCFLAKPYYALSEMQRGKMDSHPELWRHCKNPCLVRAMYEILCPTVSCVWSLIEEPPMAMTVQETSLDYLRRFILSLSSALLGKFLSFVTGFSVCADKKISIKFNSLEGFKRRPTSKTCFMILHLSTSYESYAAFSACVKQQPIMVL